MDWSAIKASRAMRAFPLSALPESLAGRLECIQAWLEGIRIVDEDGNDTGERMPLITEDQARRLLEQFCG